MVQLARTTTRAAAVLAAVAAAATALLTGAGPARANTPDCIEDSQGTTRCAVWLNREVNKTVNGRFVETRFAARASWDRGATRGRLEGDGCSMAVDSWWCGISGSQTIVTPTAMDHLTYLTVTGVADAQWSGTSTGRRELLSPTTLLVRNRAVDAAIAHTSYNLRFTQGPASQLTNETRSRIYFGTQSYDLRAVRTVDLHG